MSEMKFTQWEPDAQQTDTQNHWVEFKGHRTLAGNSSMAILPKIQELTVDPTDVWVCTFMKSGTTWMQHIVYLIMTKNFEANKIIDEYLFLEMDPKKEFGGDADKKVAHYEAMTSPRLIKTHLPYHLLPKQIPKGKVIYVARNIRDTAVSAFHFAKGLKNVGYHGDVHQYLKKMVTDNVLFGPWSEHVLGYNEQCKSDPNVIFLTYEDMQEDHAGSVRKVAAHLGQTLTDDEVAKIVKATTFENAKDTPAVNMEFMKKNLFKEGVEFMRKGKVGDWQNHFNEEDVKLADDYMEKHFKDSGMPKFKYTL